MLAVALISMLAAGRLDQAGFRDYSQGDALEPHTARFVYKAVSPQLLIETSLGVDSKWKIIIGNVYEHQQLTGPSAHFLLTLPSIFVLV